MADAGPAQSTSGPIPSRIDLAAVLASTTADGSSATIRIGKYQLKQEIGGGGMGVVFEAVHDDLRHSVAVKLMKFRAASRESLDRFIREARVLASCHHQGIAQVYDAGTQQQGDHEIPYYVMELVRGGRTITRYAHDKQLSIEQKLELFAKVCDAMQSVHDLGIVHRDIKPENILVDSSGQPKVIDFGVARVLNADLPLPASQTAGDSLLGTLPYMSPEQTGSEAGHIDRRSDVYSLGVLLYEMLCGWLPYSVKDKTLAEAIRIIQEVPPARPRDVNPALDEDIETILLKALHKDRDRRYDSAGALATSIRHRLRGEPIPDRRDSATYVFRKAAQARATKHPIVSLLVCAALAILGAEAIDRLADKVGVDNRLFAAMTALVPVRGSNGLKHVCIVAITPDTDIQKLAEKHGISGVDPTVPPSARRLHDLLMKKLSTSRVRVVAFDMYFPGSSEFDSDMVRGVSALRDHGVPVVVGIKTWETPNGMPQLAPALASEVRWGCVTGQFGPTQPWSLDLIFRRPGSVSIPSIALATAAAYWYPQSMPAYELQPMTDVAVVYESGELQAQSRKLDLTFASARRTDEAINYGIRNGDTVGQWHLSMPSDESIKASTISYAEVLDATPQALSTLFADKVALVGDQRAGKDGPHPLSNQRQLYGHAAQAAGIDSILRGRPVRMARLVNVLGVIVWSRYLIDAAGLVAGVLIGYRLFSRAGARVSCIAAVGVAALAGCIALYWLARILVNPLAFILALLFAAESVALVMRLRQQQAR